jgi:Mn2+/Fe2+ NRAMP family transporter
MKRRNHFSILVGAAFLMATSAIGPGFLTQTTVYTYKLSVSFGFVILLSVIIDIIAQVSIWRVLTVTHLRAQDLGNRVFPKLGTLLSVLIALGGLVFNIGNLAGTGLGIQAIFGLKIEIGVLLSTFIVAFVFFKNEDFSIFDFFVKILGLLMIILLVALVFKTDVPFFSALKGTFFPSQIDFKATVTLVGGTVGGYITFAGAHRLIDAKITGPKNLKKVTQSAFLGILLTGSLRYLLFLGTLGLLISGMVLNNENPTSSVFLHGFGLLGKITFGLMIWAASITSVLGATYTSISFLKSLHPIFEERKSIISILFTAISCFFVVLVGKPVALLLFAGYVNGFILPLGLLIVVLATFKPNIMKNYRHHPLLTGLSILVILIMTIFSIYSLF